MNDEKPRMTPGDFFLYLGVLITLYVSAIALITFLFTIVDIAFPNRQDIYFNPTGPIGWSLSVFIVFYPILLILLGTVRNGVIKDPSKANLGVRKWFIFLTLFVTGLTIAIDLIVLVNHFLSGEQLTGSFVLKILSIILVAGVIFWFSFKDLKGAFVLSTKLFNMFRVITTFVVVGLVVTGLFLMGSPSKLREANDDLQRVDNLNFIQSELISYWQAKETLPENLDDLNDPLRGFEVPTDPKTSESYKYSVLNPTTFELCATFATENLDNGSSRGYLTGFDHGTGEVCFERNIDKDKFPLLKNAQLRP